MRLFALETPVPGNTDIDSLHDLLQFGSDRNPGLLTHYRLPVLLILLCAVTAALFALPRFAARILGDFSTEKYRVIYCVMSCFVVLILLSLLLDMKWLPVKGHQALEECFELDAALVMLIACYVLYKTDTFATR